MKFVTAALAALLPLSACSEAEAPQDGPIKTVASQPKITPAIPVSVKEARRGPVDLTPYVGKYPFDVVNGHRFLDHPAVKAAVAAAVPDAKARAGIAFADRSLGIPIVRVAGGRILIWGGEWRAEDRYNWAVIIAPDGSKPEVCIYDAGDYDADLQSSSWYTPGQPAVMKQGTCPSTAEDYPLADIAAG
ncbi:MULTISPECIES: hypothetical protein [unclassified Sphingopyxis]|uniref:hypothetical protein n=1 Tax=unclassified Sphingopyxis TaxID=2614943 RepID=UPI0028668825|nr:MULTISPECIES: hypothetical protein [unclassified Sphingopyxis]MDR6834144.1 hypothetical protein [Sphingopyxis sp. BE122]MDR7226412.1 hypothetical protein [Sphingopyxis sp. BE259]